MDTLLKKNEFLLAIMIVISCFLALYNTTAINVALPVFMKQFEASIVLVQWIMIGYTVIMGVMSPLSGWFVRTFTLKKYFVVSMWTYAILSLFSGLSNNLYILIIVRCIQGLAGSALIPVTMIAIYRFIPSYRQPTYLTIQNMSLSLGPAVGPVLAGLLITLVGWRWIFLINVPFAVMAALIGMYILPDTKAVYREHIDFLSLGSIILGCMLVLLSFSFASRKGVSPVMIILMLVVGLTLCGWFITRQRRLTNPILSFTMLREKEYRLSLVVNALLSMALCLVPFVLAIYFQNLRHYSAFSYGVLLLIPAIFSIGGAPISQWLYHCLSSKIIILVGLIFLVIGNIGLVWIRIDSMVSYIIFCLCIRYFGIGLLGMPITDHGMCALTGEQTDDGATLINWTKLMATSLSLSAFTLVYTIVVQHAVVRGDYPEISGISAVFLCSGILLLLGFFIGLRLDGHHKHALTEEGVE